MLIGLLGEKRRNRVEAIFEEIMAKDFSKMMKDIQPQI